MNTPTRTPSLGWLAALCCAALHSVPAAAAAPNDLASTLHWDLSYRTVLRDHPIPSNELVALWAAELPDSRPIQEALARYAGAPVEAAVLIETPDNRKGDSDATWFIKTKKTAQVCTIEPDEDERCHPLDPARTEAFVRTVMNLRMPALDPAEEHKGTSIAAAPVLLGYRALLSVWIDGRVLQRPVAAREFAAVAREWHETGRPGANQLSDAIDALKRMPPDRRDRKTTMTQAELDDALMTAARDGVTDETGRLLDQGARIDGPRDEQQALAFAVDAGRLAAVDLLLKRGAPIDAHDSQALRIAIVGRTIAMVDRLLDKGARPDGAPGTEVAETPLGLAVGIPDRVIAQHLIQHGANPNTPQARAPQSRALLATAALNHDLPMMDLLIGAGAHPDWTDSSGRTAIMLVLHYTGEHERVLRETHPGKHANVAAQEPIVRRLVAAGADVNYTTGTCQSALSMATEYGLDTLVTLLKSLGADPQRAASCAAGQGAARR